MPPNRPDSLLATPAEWRSRTALRISARPALLVKVDKAYDEYYKSRNNSLAATNLLFALNNFVTDVGSWDRSERNRKSGGLMRLVHEQVTRQGEKQGWAKAGNGGANGEGVKRLQTVDIPHSRYGVLYLLGNLQIEINHYNVALDGVSAVGGAVAQGLAVDYTGHKGGGVIGKEVMGARTGQVISGGQLAAKVGAGLNKPIDKAKAAGTRTNFSEAELAQQRKDRATKVDNHAAVGWPTSTMLLEEIGEDPLLFLNPFVLPGTLIVGATVAIAEALNNLRLLLMDKLTSMAEKIKAMLIADGSFKWEMSGRIIKNMVKFIVGKCLASAAPLIGGLMDVGGGLMATLRAAEDRVSTYMHRRHVKLTEGHAWLIGETIEGQMEMGIFSGLATLLKGVGNLALQTFLPGAGNLVSMVLTGIEWLYKMLYRWWESSKIATFLDEAKKLYQIEQGRATVGKIEHRTEVGEITPSAVGLVHQTPEFTKFFERGCKASPVIPMLVLNSGICGSLMTMIQMVEGNGQTLISSSNVTEGAEYFTRLKDFGRRYLTKSGFKFSSTNPSVTRYLQHAMTRHQRETNARNIGAFLAS
jgi:hypothetical protein